MHAVRTVAEASYRDLMQTLVAQHPQQFQVIHFVSREQTDFALPGRIPQAITQGVLEEKAACVIDAASSQVMLCGNPEMVKDSTAVLEARGLTRNRRRTPGHITVEAYW